MDSAEASQSATARGLPILAAVVAQPAVLAHLAAPAAVDPLLDPPRSKSVPAILNLLARRGLDPDAMTWLLPQFDALDRALLAWDIVNGSLLKTDGELDAFREFAAEGAPLLGVAGRRGCGPDVVAAIAPRLGDSSRPTGEVLEEAATGRFAAVVELRARGTDLATRARLELPKLREHAQQLARAHFPTLASLQLGILWQAFDDREALLDWVDVLADIGRYDALPSLDRLDSQHRAYVEYRSALAAEDPAAAMAAARVLRTQDDVRALAVRVDVGARTKRTDETARQRIAASADQQSRFVARVDTVARIIAGEAPVAAIDRFLGRFGNDVELWRDLATQADRVSGLAAACETVIARELQWLPHDPSAWQGLALMVGEPVSSAISNELAQRLIAQSTLS